MQIIKYIPLQQGLRLFSLLYCANASGIIKYIPLQQGLRHQVIVRLCHFHLIIKYIPLQQGLRQISEVILLYIIRLLSIFHYNKD